MLLRIYNLNVICQATYQQTSRPLVNGGIQGNTKKITKREKKNIDYTVQISFYHELQVYMLHKIRTYLQIYS